MAQGLSNIGIGQQLFVSPKTVERHVSSVFTKLGLSTDTHVNQRVRAVVLWVDDGHRQAESS